MGNNVKSILTGYMRFYPWSLFLELATVGGPFYFTKWGLTCCQRGRYFDLLWGSSYKALKTLFPLLKLMRNTIYLFIPRLLNVIKCYFSLNSSPCSSTSLVVGVLIREELGGTSDWEMQYSTVLLLRDRLRDRLLLELRVSSASEGTGTISSASEGTGAAERNVTLAPHSVHLSRLHRYDGQSQDSKWRLQLLHLQRVVCGILGILKSFLDAEVSSHFI